MAARSVRHTVGPWPRVVLLVVLLVAGVGYWLWNTTRPDHDGGHGQPLTVGQMNELATGTFQVENGRERDVTHASCRAGADGEGRAPSTHFRCDLRFANRERRAVVLHVLPGALWFESDLA